MGQLTLSMGPARAKVCRFVQRATIPSKKVIFYIQHLKNPTHVITFCICYYIVRFKNTFSPLQVKNRPHGGDL